MKVSVVHQLFEPRQHLHACSQKPSTVQTRQRELKRRGLSAAVMKLKNKWRARRYVAKKRIQETKVYIRLNELAPASCQKYLDSIDDQFNQLRDEEIIDVTILWYTLQHEKGESK